MTLEEFIALTEEDQPPDGLSILLTALWFDRKGDWGKAHELAQTVPTETGSLVHAYLHRKEGDPGNARYWYHRSGRPESRKSLEEEWESIVTELLST